MSNGNGKKPRKPIKPKGTRHRDWQSLETKFVTGQYASLEEFAKSEGLPPDAVRKQSAKKGWLKRRTEIAHETQKMMAGPNAEMLAEANSRHLNTALTLQKIGMKKLAQARLQPAEALRAVSLGVNMERAALGLDLAERGELPSGDDNRVQTIIQVFNGSSERAKEDFRRVLRKLLGNGSAPSSSGNTT